MQLRADKKKDVKIKWRTLWSSAQRRQDDGGPSGLAAATRYSRVR